jgi:uncharacterized protein involved in outer membrane biogenesis
MVQTVKISPKFVLGVLATVAIVLGLLVVAPKLIDMHKQQERVVQIIQEKIGRTVNVKGKMNISLLPTPIIYLSNVELRDTEGNTPIPSLIVDMIKFDVPFTQLLSDHPNVLRITLQHPTLEVERAQDNLIHWDWLNLHLLKAAGADNVQIPGIDITDGTIVYHDIRTGKEVSLENMTASMSYGTRLAIKASFTTYGHRLESSFSTDGNPAVQAGVPFTAELHEDSRNSLRWEGNLDLRTDNPKITGKFDLALKNVMEWTNTIKTKIEQNKSPLAAITNRFTRQEEPTEEESQVPINITGDWSQDGMNVTLNNTVLHGLNSDGTGKLSLGWKNSMPLLGCTMKFSTLDYNQWQTFLTAAFVPPPSTTTTGEELHVNPLPKDVQVTLALASAQTIAYNQTIKNISLMATIADATMTVNQFNVELPGKSSLTLFGVISQSATNVMRFEGTVETMGKSLREALTMVDETAVNLPDAGFGAFHAHSNIFISAEQLRLSEADLKLSDLALNGGLVAYFDARPRLEADAKLKDINLDYVHDVWFAKPKDAAKDAGKNTPNTPNAPTKLDKKNLNFTWLNKLKTSIDFKVNVNGFTFMRRKGNNASFRIYAKDGEFGLYEIRLNYPDDTMEGSFNFNVKNAQPTINIILNANTIDPDYFMLTPQNTVGPPAPAPAPQQQANTSPANGGKKIWSKAFIDTSWMDGFNGTFDINIGQLSYDQVTINRVKFQGKLDNRLLTFKNFTFDYWRGRCSILGTFYGGEVPGVSISFMLYDIDLHDMLKEVSGRDNITGAGSISGTMVTSGVNMLSWVSQADGKLVVAGRGVNVNGFNLQGVTDAVNISRTSADVVNNVNMALLNGATEFTVDGNANVKNGIIKSPGFTLKAGAIIGDLTGDIQMVPWTVDLSMLFQFPVITSETIPTMTVHLSGSIDKPILVTDTSSFEAYVAKRIISK